jgi:hypothetical protein
MDQVDCVNPQSTPHRSELGDHWRFQALEARRMYLRQKIPSWSHSTELYQDWPDYLQHRSDALKDLRKEFTSRNWIKDDPAEFEKVFDEQIRDIDHEIARLKESPGAVPMAPWSIFW